MAGARPSGFKKGGGFLNNVDGVIEDYQFTDVFPGSENRPPKKAKPGEEVFHSLYCLLTVRVDGAADPVQTTLFAGNADDFDISEDGHTLTPLEEGIGLGASTEFGEFVSSLVSPKEGDGFPEDLLPEDDINFEVIIGTRCRFVQVTKIDRKTGKPRMREVKKGKFKGKSFEATSPQVEMVYSLPGASKTAGKGKGTPPGRSSSTGARKTVPAPVPDESDTTELAKGVLLGILEAKGEAMAKAKLSVPILQACTKDKALKGIKDDIRKTIFDDEQLEAWAEEGVITFNKSAKDQPIGLAG